jgi:phage tail sheath protein FI
VEAILQQVGAVIVVVRVADGTGISDGLDVLKTAKGVTGYEPRILSALWFGEVGDGIAVKLAQVTDELRACSAANYNSPTDSESEADGGAIGTARVKILGPSKLRMSMFGGIYEIHASAAWAGLRAKVDYEQGFWVSESNKVIAGVVSISNLPTWSIGDPASEANQLNEKNVTTFIRENGFRVWGNRGANGDFQSVQRTRDIINDSVQRAHLWAVDRNIVKTYFEDVTEGVNAYLRNLISLGAITGGTCWPDPDLNTPQNIAQGKVYFNFDIGFAYPAEHVIFQSFINDDYLNNLLK